MAILRYLAQYTAATVEEIAQALSLQPQTAQRALNTMHQRKFVARATDRRWKLGVALLRIANTVPSQLLEVAQDQVERLAEETGGSAILAIPQYPNFIVIMERDGRQGPLRLESLASVGYPLDKAPPGIAILSHLPSDQRVALIGAGAGTAAGAAAGATTAGQVESQCQHVLDHGWVVVPSQVIRSRHGIAAPIFGADGQVEGSLTIALPTAAADRLASFAPSLIQATNTIHSRLAAARQRHQRLHGAP